MLSISAKVAKRGAYMQDTTVTAFSHVCQGKILDYMKRMITIYFKVLECSFQDSNWEEKMTFHYGSPDGFELKRPLCIYSIDFKAGLCYFGNRIDGSLHLLAHGIASHSLPVLFWLHQEYGGPGIFSHVRDIKGRKDLIECRCTGLRTATRAKVPGNLPHTSS